MTFTELADLVFTRSIRYDADANLPQPNVYWGTASTADNRTHNAYVAGMHTRPALARFIAVANLHLRLRLSRSNSVLHMRRLKLGDLMENPGAFQQALDHAKAFGDWECADLLERLPVRLAEQLGLIIDHDAAAAVLCVGSAAAERTLRPALPSL